MNVTFWGVRGSMPTPGPTTLRYGGNTPCLSIGLGAQTLIIDAGSGIRALGKRLALQTEDILLMISHLHWDHVQGLPFFAPVYQPRRPVFVFPPSHCGASFGDMTGMDGVHFPVTTDQLACAWECVRGEPALVLRSHGFDVTRVPVNHPGGCDGFRIEQGGRAVVFIPDNEIDPPYPQAIAWQDLVRFCAGAEVLIHDAQYVEADMPDKRGWGHSLVSQACALAAEAGVRRLLLFHHDPERCDEALDGIEVEARAWLQRRGSSVACTVAAEGMTLEV